MPAGSWSLAEEMFARGDAGFVDELRRVNFASRLGEFAARWIVDTRWLAARMGRPRRGLETEPRRDFGALSPRA